MKEVVRCRLAVEDDDNEGNLVIVADGFAHPTPQGVLHTTSSMLPGHYRVSVDSPYLEHYSVAIPVPLLDEGVYELGQAKGCFVQWPMTQVFFEDQVSA